MHVHEGGDSRSLQVALEYREATRDYRHVAQSITSEPLHSGPLETGSSFAFELGLPQDALPSLASAHGVLSWVLDAKSDERGRDTHATEPIVVVGRDLLERLRSADPSVSGASLSGTGGQDARGFYDRVRELDAKLRVNPQQRE